MEQFHLRKFAFQIVQRFQNAPLRVILLALEHYHGADPINIGTGSEVAVAIHELARRIALLTRFTGKIHWDPSDPEGTMRRVLDVSRAQKEFNFRARRSLPDGLFETIEWYRATKTRPPIPAESPALEQSA
jgi:nucleoside-diphosphate-sugar epimerase